MSQKDSSLNKKIAGLIIATFLLFFFTPYAFIAKPRHLIFNYVELVNESYKIGKDILKIIFGFWLANTFLERVRERDTIQSYDSQKRRIILNILNALETIEQGSAMNNISVQEFENAKAKLAENLLDFRRLSNQINAHVDFAHPLMVMADEFNELERYEKEIFSWVNSDDSPYGKPLKPKTVKCIKKLKKFFKKHR